MDFNTARQNMVECQIRPNQVTDERIIDAMLEIPREKFVPGEMSSVAYVDEALPIGNNRCLMEPMLLARLLQEAAIRPEDLVLVLGCGTGYSAAIAARLAGTVVALEEDPAMVGVAGEALSSLDIDNAAVVEGKMTAGYPEQAPFDVIILGGSVEDVPASIFDQLSGEGGRLSAIRMRANQQGKGILAQKFGDNVTIREFMDGGSPYLPGFEPVPAFSF
ncbi:MAG: protein-L-isoaspartate O-methyltransferase [Proteobacteria bacterium]|nr:protein-L-isoaspartate O-methyltransferase [Pseudomonadota bacterium]